MSQEFAQLSVEDQARISCILNQLDLNPKEHFKGSLTIEEGQSCLISPSIINDSGYSTVVSAKNIAEAKRTIGVPDSNQHSLIAEKNIETIPMIPLNKKKSDLSKEELCALRRAKRLFIFSDSNKTAHMEPAINTYLADEMDAVVYIYPTLNIHGNISFSGDGKPVLLLAHTINIYEGGEIVLVDSPSITVQATTVSYEKSLSNKALPVNDYDVEIILADGKDAGVRGEDGKSADNQPKAADGKDASKGKDKCKGGDGSNGKAGDPGDPGDPGGSGESSPDGVFFIKTLNCSILVQARGADGGAGGNGGNGGNGGQGGNGGKGNVEPDGNGGAGGNGGNGGTGGSGGIGGNGGIVTLYAQDLNTKIFHADVNSGNGGAGGQGGKEGIGGTGGSGQTPGKTGENGTPGKNGDMGKNGTVGSIIVKKAYPPVIDNFNPSIGPKAGGTQITINGQNFYKDAKGNPIIQFTLNGIELTNLNFISEICVTGDAPASDSTGQYQLVAFNTETKAVGVSEQFYTYTDS